jgi:hypothetical protein
MRKQSLNEIPTAGDTENQVVPDYRAWQGLQEAKKSLLMPILDFLRTRALHEITAMVAMVEIYLVTRDIIRASGNGLLTPMRMTCIMVCVALIFALAVIIYLTSYARSRNDAKAVSGRKTTTQP